MTSRAIQWMGIMRPEAFYGTPSFALHLAETARKEGVDPASLGVKKLFFSGEPGASVPGVRDRIARAFDGQVFDCGSMAEMSPFMNVAGSAETDGMLCWQDVIYTEVCDPATYRRVPYGERGTPVYTHLERTSQPMIRLVSGDLTRWTFDANPCGRTYPRLPEGIFGRIDDMFTIRGENVYPSEIDAALNQVPGYGGEHRIVITRAAAMDELMLRVEAAPDVEQRGGEAVRSFKDTVAKRIHTMLGLRAGVEIVPAGSIPRTDFKARRVVDDREVFRELNQKLSEERRP
jgi:phenylacetate-CoA ligase